MAELQIHHDTGAYLTSKLADYASFRGNGSIAVQCSALHEIKEDIDKIEHALIRFRRQRNTLVPVSCLPPEIISHIFQLVTLSYSPKDVERLFWHPSITISQVCSHWRQVALANPWMWVDIPCIIGDDNMRAFLQHSSSMPIQLRLSSEKQGYALAALKSHIYRIENITIMLEEEESDFLPTCLEHLTLSAPSLRSLSIRFKSFDVWSIPDLDTSLELPIHLFGGDAHTLRSISLCGINLNWLSFSLINIETLHLHTVDLPPAAQLSSLLNSRPLKTLTVAHCLLPDRAVPSTHTAELPYLSTLQVTGQRRLCTGLLTIIKTAPTCSLQIKCDIDDWDYDDDDDDEDSDSDREDSHEGSRIRVLLYFIATHLKQLSPSEPLLQSVSLAGDSAENLDLKIWRTEGDSLNSFTPAKEPFISVKIDYLVPALRRILPLNTVNSMVQAMVLSIAPRRLTQQYLRTFLVPYVSLKHLKIQRTFSSGHSDLCYLSPVLSASPDSVSRSFNHPAIPSQPFLPSLATLELDTHCIKGSSTQGNPNCAFYEALFNTTIGPHRLHQIIFRTDQDCRSECAELQSVLPNISISNEDGIGEHAKPDAKDSDMMSISDTSSIPSW